MITQSSASIFPRKHIQHCKHISAIGAWISPLWRSTDHGLVSSTLDTLLIQDSDFDTEKGLDNFLLTTAHADGKEIYEVESVDFQLNMLINFSDDIYDLMFRSYEGETKESQKQALEDLYTAWKSGDIETFLEEDNEEELAGYTYVVDTCTECPHCGAPIPPEDQPGARFT